jgi:hypothetical protein
LVVKNADLGYNRNVRRTLLLSMVLSISVLVGCDSLGFVASKLPPPTRLPAYDGLTDQSIAVVVWAVPEVDVDHPRLARQVGTLVEQNLLAARDDGSRRAKATLEGMTVAYPAQAYVRYFRDDPSLALLPGSELAPLTGARRVILVEIGGFTTRGAAAPNLVRGVADVNLTVYEVDEPVTTATESAGLSAEGQVTPGREAYRESAIEFVYPPRGAEEGESRLRDEQAYEMLVREVAAGVAKRFVPHTAEEL